MPSSRTVMGLAYISIGCYITYVLYRTDNLQPLPPTRLKDDVRTERLEAEQRTSEAKLRAEENLRAAQRLPFGTDDADAPKEQTAWTSFTGSLSAVSDATTSKLSAVTEQISGYILPEWATQVPGYIRKLQRELSMAPGSLADEIWCEARDPDVNPEIRRHASVRVSADLCNEEKLYLKHRRERTRRALAEYLDIPEDEIDPEDVPIIAMVGSGGGLRALVAGTGSFLAAKESGLFDCVTYTAGVSGSCWGQVLYHSSLGRGRFDKVVQHLKARIGIHIAYPPVALAALNSAPTNKYLLAGFVEKLKGDDGADFGLVDVYGLLLAARLLVPKGEVGVNEADLKLSNQREHIRYGEQPMPIYTAVRHEIPIEEEASSMEKETGAVSEATKEKAKREAFFQWFEISPYEMFCEEFSAGIPTWAMGRRFENGESVPRDGLHPPELRVPLLLGTFGSAFCATLSHYYKEVKPLLKGLVGFAHVDEMIEGHDDDLSKVHPIEPASMPNFAYKMDGRLPETTPASIYKKTHLQLMDAGMSNNLPIYPLLRPGRNVDILVAFDSSADVKTDNWLSVADGYAKQRGVKGWPVGLGWPKSTDTAEKTVDDLDAASAKTVGEAETKLAHARDAQDAHLDDVIEERVPANSDDAADAGDLGYCTVWVGTTEERSSASSEPPISKASEAAWQLTQPDAGIAVVYFPFLSNARAVAGVDPLTSEYMSTWNFVYTPSQIDQVVALARANFAEGHERTRATVRAVYERKKRQRLARERADKEARWRHKVRLGQVGRTGDGDHFHLT